MDRLEKQLLRDATMIYRAALQAADAGVAIGRHVRIQRRHVSIAGRKYSFTDFDRIHLIAIGKAAGTMALALEEILGSALSGGLVITKHGHAVSGLRICRQRTGAHPIPDQQGLAAAAEAEQLLRQLNRRDLLLVAVSGGASALMPLPAEGVTLEAKQKTTDLLLRAGADIHQLNAVRKHLSALKGGGMAALAYPATTVGLLLSDVIGDPLGVIGSGPTAPDESTYADAIQVLERLGLRTRVPTSVRQYLESGLRGHQPETPKPEDPIFRSVANFVVGNNHSSLQAAASAAKKLGYNAAILSSTISGETREVAPVLSEILKEVVRSNSPIPKPACLLAGGETTVTVQGQGRGGRNQEFALSAARSIAGVPGVLILSLGTDGTDGPTDAAGAYATGSTIARGEKAKLNADQMLSENNSYRYFRKLGDLVKTGPTGTNVMDICLMMAADA